MPTTATALPVQLGEHLDPSRLDAGMRPASETQLLRHLDAADYGIALTVSQNANKLTIELRSTTDQSAEPVVFTVAHDSPPRGRQGLAIGDVRILASSQDDGKIALSFRGADNKTVDVLKAQIHSGSSLESNGNQRSEMLAYVSHNPAVCQDFSKPT